MIILGLTGGFHFGACDAAAAVVKDGKVLSCVEEERVSRIKNSFGMPPSRCVKSALEVAGIRFEDIDRIAYYLKGYPDAQRELSEHFIQLFGSCPPIEGVHHHLAHAASSYYASGFDESAVLCCDWSGDGVSTSLWQGKGGTLEMIEEIARPNSLGIFYALFTQFLGFERGDEYKVMGLAAYGTPEYAVDDILDISGDIYQLNTDFINAKNRSMHQIVFNDKLAAWNPSLRRPSYAKLEAKHKNLAASVQRQFEAAVLKLAKRALQKTGMRNLCLAGGSALNCSSNGKLVAANIADHIYLPPFPNDTGCAYGAAVAVAAQAGYAIPPLATSQLGPQWSDEAIKKDLDLLHIKAEKIPDIHDAAAQDIARGKLVGWFQGGMEAGPRALGGRSILADPRDKTVKERINARVKFREDFRPFAPSVLLRASQTYFDFAQPSPFMSFIAPVNTPDTLPGITHIDGTARLHTVDDETSAYGILLGAMERHTGHPVVLNTSFNYMGQPMVCSPKEAIYTFFGTGLDTLAIGNWLVRK